MSVFDDFDEGVVCRLFLNHRFDVVLDLHLLNDGVHVQLVLLLHLLILEGCADHIRLLLHGCGYFLTEGCAAAIDQRVERLCFFHCIDLEFVNKNQREKIISEQ